MNNLSNFKFPIFQFFLVNYLIFNSWMLDVFKNYEQLFFSNIISKKPFWLYFLFINFLISLLIFTKKLKISHSPIFYILGFIFFQIVQKFNAPVIYFWETIPDARTYKSLGESLFKCGRLEINCSGEPFLQWPIGQPIISGILSKYFYEYAHYLYVLFFSIAIYVVLYITYKKFGKWYHFGAGLFFLMQNNYEITMFIISEIPYLLFTVLGLYFLFYKNYNVSLLFLIFSVLIRPIGIVNIFGYLLFLLLQKKYKRLNISLLLIFISYFLIITYNKVNYDQFVFSETVSTNIQNDSIVKNSDTRDFIFNTFTKENLIFVKGNIQRLYGPGSRDCVFEYCTFYNPLFTEEGTVPNFIPRNTVMGYTFNKVISELFKTGSPLGFWVYLPLLYLFLLRRKDQFTILIIFLFFSNIALSVLTAEYGSRWWLMPNLLSIYLFSNLIYKIFNKLTTRIT